MYMHLFLLMYADDTIVLSESPDDMQECLNALAVYCNSFGLEINTSKTKVVVFSRGKIRKLPKFQFKDKNIDIVWDYKYLGTVFNYNNKFAVARSAQAKLANKAMFGLLRKSRKLDLPLDIQLDLFDKCIIPILLFGCEVWAHEAIDECERVQLRFFKILLSLRKTTATCMVLGELGKFPLYLEAKCRMLTYWFKLSTADCDGPQKISVVMLRLCRNMYDSTDYKMSWLKGVHSLLNDLGLTYIWLNPRENNYSIEYFKSIVKERLRDQFLQRWREELNTNALCLNYRLFKQSFACEDYLITLPQRYRTIFLRFRTCNHRLPIQRLRQFGIDRNLRVCTLCNKNDIGDEFHYLFKCSYPPLCEKRKMCLPKFYLHHANVLKMNDLMNISSKRKLTHLSRFIEFIMSLF